MIWYGLIPLGVTMMSAGSHTEPGGYTGAGEESIHQTQRGSRVKRVFSQFRGHDDGGLHAEQTRRERHGLGMIARGKGDHSAGPRRGGQARQRVEGTAKLERADALEVLAFEEYRGAQRLVDGARGHHRGAVGVPLQPPHGGLYIGIGRRGRLFATQGAIRRTGAHAPRI